MNPIFWSRQIWMPWRTSDSRGLGWAPANSTYSTPASARDLVTLSKSPERFTLPMPVWRRTLEA